MYSVLIMVYSRKGASVYEALVKDKEDVRGAIAYALYKRQKIAYLDQFEAEFGRRPNEAEFAEFRRVCTLDQSIDAYSGRAGTVLDGFLKYAAQKEARETQRALMAAQAAAFASMSAEVRASAESQTASTREGTRQIVTLLERRQSFGAWLASLGSNLIINLVSIVLIGLAAVGLGAIDNLSASIAATLSRPAGERDDAGH